ncbi:hypothetical protein GGR95_001135 [Sulfitobacter undariae]|uniref:DUF4174 domain-containing protein n=1 Tax=Sulfitobacter undariae TaxID=1563671 RepID=A0A7W6E6F9_9RHOB|nr:DUF4174 domain-containing protein [Sulfitobacter undariae]MBB3993507.1 hypothetical protein [Sulfitobacter undariae]
MKTLLAAVIIATFAGTLQAQTLPETDAIWILDASAVSNLSEFKWKKRPVIVFADSENDPAFIEQMTLLTKEVEDLAERDVVVIVDTAPAARSAIRLRMRPRGFMLTLMDKAGDVELRKPFPWSVREITRSIDKMSIRQREIREENATVAE